MTQSSDVSRHRFTVMGALGFAAEVFKARPQSMIRFSLVSFALMLVSAGANFALMGQLAIPMMDAVRDGDTATFVRLNGYFSLSSMGITILTFLGYMWLEVVGLRLFLQGRLSWRFGGPVYGRLLVSYLVICGVWIGGYLACVLATVLLGMVVLIPAAAFSAPELGIAFIGALGLLGVIALMVLMVRFTAVPADIVLKDRFVLRPALADARRYWGRLLLVWLVWSVLYLVVMVLTIALTALFPHGWGRILWDMLSQLDNPYVQYEGYAMAFSSFGGGALFLISLVPAYLASVGLMMIARGIGAKLALTLADDAQATEARDDD